MSDDKMPADWRLGLCTDEIERLRAERDALVKEDEIKAGVNRALLAEIERLRAVLVAAKGLNAESEEYDFDYGLGRAAPNSYWEELDDAIEAIDAAKEQR